MLNFSSTGLASALLGADCVLCGEGGSAGMFCAACDAFLPRLGTATRPPRGCDELVAAFDYRFPLDRLVQRFKFQADLALGAWLARELAQRVSALPRPDALVAPPLAPARLRSRGFNQSVELGRALARALGVPLRPFAVRRTRDTPAQRTLDARARRANLRGAFECAAPVAEYVAIIDDVVTTGATAEAMARALRQAGARRVALWAVARTP